MSSLLEGFVVVVSTVVVVVVDVVVGDDGKKKSCESTTKFVLSAANIRDCANTFTPSWNPYLPSGCLDDDASSNNWAICFTDVIRR